jgi:hypothetical protein
MSYLSFKGTIQEMWAEDPALIVLHPASRFYTGRVPTIKPTSADPAPPAMPYTRLEAKGSGRGERTSSSEMPLEFVKFHIWTDTADEADAIADAVVNCYSNKAWWYTMNTYDQKVLDTRYDGTSQSQITEPNYTAWETVVSFTMRTWRERVT